MTFYKTIRSLLIFFCFSFILNGCSKIPKPDWSKPIEPNAKKRAQQNARDGNGIGIPIFDGNKKGGDFLFASSNPMWKSTLDTLSFISLANVDYSGGIIITDWYSDGNTDEAIKITVRFLSNEIRADGLTVKIYKRDCIKEKCNIKEIKTNLVVELKDSILKKAVNYQKSSKTNRAKKSKKVYKDN